MFSLKSCNGWNNELRIQSNTCFFPSLLLTDNVILEENISPWFDFSSLTEVLIAGHEGVI